MIDFLVAYLTSYVQTDALGWYQAGWRPHHALLYVERYGWRSQRRGR